MKDSLVYPGEYTPLQEVDQFSNEMIAWNEINLADPFLNLLETSEGFNFEVVIPHSKKEDVYAYVDNQQLFIEIFSESNSPNANKITQRNASGTLRANYKILLPPNADTEFIYAVFVQGTLQFYFPKNSGARAGIKQTVIVH